MTSSRPSPLTVPEIERVVAMNFGRTVHLTKAFLPFLVVRPEVVRPDASLVNVSSRGALVPFTGQSADGASKAAVKLFTEGINAKLRASTVAAAVAFPGAVGTNTPVNSGVDIPVMHEPGAKTPKAIAPA